MSITKLNRRTFIKISCASLATIPIVCIGEDKVQRLAEDDPAAIALGYKEISSEIEAEKYPNHKSEQICSGCLLYTGENPDWGGCSAFPGKQVAGGGWCTAFAPKPA